MSTVISGTLFDGEVLGGHPVALALEGGRLVSAHDAGATVDVAIDQVRISSRLGRMPRYLYLDARRVVETPDNDAVDVFLANRGQHRLAAIVHALEVRSRVAAAATLLLVATIGAAIWWGLPAAARRVAIAVPDDVERQAGRAGLATLKQVLGPTQLKAAEQARIRELADKLCQAGGISTRPEIVFRSMGGAHPNAFALPGGVLVISDELVALTTDDELAAVLAHEIGHWQSRHGIQSVLRNSFALLVVTGVTGDLSSLTTFAGTIPFLLLQRGYSREFETEADRFAIGLLKKARIDPRNFPAVLEKLHDARPDKGADFSYLSTHPSTADRIESLHLPPGRPPPPEVRPPRALVQPPPAYPPGLQDQAGSVVVEFVVDTTGRPIQAKVVKSTLAEFEKPALAAIAKWRFEPGTKGGRPVDARVTQVFEFSPRQTPVTNPPVLHED